MQIWERISEWLFIAVFTLAAGWAALFRKRHNEHIDSLRESQSVLMVKVDAQKDQLSEHDKRLEIASLHIDKVNGDLSEIKNRIGSLHTRITESNKDVNDKLDRLLQRER